MSIDVSNKETTTEVDKIMKLKMKLTILQMIILFLELTSDLSVIIS